MTSAYKPKSRTGRKSAARGAGWMLSALLFGLASGASAQSKPDAPPAYDVKANYTKYEYRIPMRDGVHLFTSIYVPKDTSKKYPFLLNRTPYSVSPYASVTMEKPHLRIKKPETIQPGAMMYHI